MNHCMPSGFTTHRKLSPCLYAFKFQQELVLTAALKCIGINKTLTKNSLFLTFSLSMRFLQSAGTSLLDFFNFVLSIFILKVFVDWTADGLSLLYHRVKPLLLSR